jgi:hypothetical protein
MSHPRAENGGELRPVVQCDQKLPERQFRSDSRSQISTSFRHPVASNSERRSSAAGAASRTPCQERPYAAPVSWSLPVRLGLSPGTLAPPREPPSLSAQLWPRSPRGSPTFRRRSLREGSSEGTTGQRSRLICQPERQARPWKKPPRLRGRCAVPLPPADRALPTGRGSPGARSCPTQRTASPHSPTPPHLRGAHDRRAVVVRHRGRSGKRHVRLLPQCPRRRLSRAPGRECPPATGRPRRRCARFPCARSRCCRGRPLAGRKAGAR